MAYRSSIFPRCRLLCKRSTSSFLTHLFSLVSAVTVAADLAIAVIVGVIASALVFAWETANNIYVEVKSETDNEKTYVLHGQLFFGSISGFRDLFHPREDPADVVIDFHHSRV